MRTNCACGQPLHYSDPNIQRIVESMIKYSGENIEIKVLSQHEVVYLVPRHFIALHGVIAKDLPELACKYKFDQHSDLYRVQYEPTPRITCGICGYVSHNPHDIEQLYCGRCHRFHHDQRPITGNDTDIIVNPNPDLN